MRKFATVVVVTALNCGGLTACSGNDLDAYCNDMKTHVDKRQQEPEKQQLDQVHKLQREAPKELADDWKTLVDLNQKIVNAGADQAKLLKIVADAKELRPALQAISKHAKEQCKVTLPTKI